MQEAVTVTETPSQDQYPERLEDANASLRRAVLKRKERHATALPPVAEAACDVTREDCCQGSRMPTSTKPVQELRPGSREFLAVLDEIRTLHLRKTLDYGDEGDALANIRSSADVIAAEPWAGAILRMSDKMHRLRSFFHNGRTEFDGVQDTLLDLAAYSAIALVLFRESQS